MKSLIEQKCCHGIGQPADFVACDSLLEWALYTNSMEHCTKRSTPPPLTVTVVTPTLVKLEKRCASGMLSEYYVFYHPFFDDLLILKNHPGNGFGMYYIAKEFFDGNCLMPILTA